MNDKQKRRRQPKAKKRIGRKAYTTAALPKLPSPFVTEQVMQSMFGERPASKFEAQDLGRETGT